MPPIAQVLHSCLAGGFRRHRASCCPARVSGKIQQKSQRKLNATLHLSVVPRSALSFGKERLHSKLDCGKETCRMPSVHARSASLSLLSRLLPQTRWRNRRLQGGGLSRIGLCRVASGCMRPAGTLKTQICTAASLNKEYFEGCVG